MSGTTIPEIFAYGEYPTSKKLNEVLAAKVDGTALTTVNTSITGLQTTVAGLVSVVGSGDGGALNSLDGRVTAVETDVAGVHTSLTTLQSTVSAITGVGPLPDQVTALSAALQAETTARQTAVSAEALTRQNTDQGIVNAIATKQDALGFVPVKQGGDGTTVTVGWSNTASRLNAYANDTPLGSLWTDLNGPKSFIATGGYHKLPSDLIIQWGKGLTQAGNQDAFLFPLTFPNANFGVTLTSIGANNWKTPDQASRFPRSLGVSSVDRFGFTLVCILLNPDGTNEFAPGEPFNFFAWGI